MAARHLLDPPQGAIHVLDLVNHAKDGIYAKDKLSDHIIGMLMWAKIIGDIMAWEGTVFQVPFVKNMKLRKKVEHAGRPFLGPDGLVLTLNGRTLHGAGGHGIGTSQLDIGGIKGHASYQTWLKNTLYAGRGHSATTYARQYTFNTGKDCDDNVNSRLYVGGPLSTAPGASSAGPSSTPSSSAAGPSSAPAPRKRKSATEDTKPSGGSGTTAKKRRKPKVTAAGKSKPTPTPTPAARRANPGKGKVGTALSKTMVSQSDDEETAPKNTGKPKAKITLTVPAQSRSKRGVKPDPKGKGKGGIAAPASHSEDEEDDNMLKEENVTRRPASGKSIPQLESILGNISRGFNNTSSFLYGATAGGTESNGWGGGGGDEGGEKFEEFKGGREGEGGRESEGEDRGAGGGEEPQPDAGMVGVEDTGTASAEDTGTAGAEDTSTAGAEGASAAGVEDAGAAGAEGTGTASGADFDPECDAEGFDAAHGGDEEGALEGGGEDDDGDSTYDPSPSKKKKKTNQAKGSGRNKR
jgi:hypothetical protein